MNDDRPELSPRMLEYAAERTRAMGRLCEAAGMEFTDDCTLMGVAEQTAQRFARAEELLESTKAQLKRTRDKETGFQVWQALKSDQENQGNSFDDLMNDALSIREALKK